MQAQTNHTDQSAPKNNAVSRALERISRKVFGGGGGTTAANAQLSASGPAHAETLSRSTASAAATTPSPTYRPQQASAARPAPAGTARRAPAAASPQVTHPAPNFSSETAELVMLATGKVKGSSGDRALAVATLNSKGFFLNEAANKIVISRAIFEAMSHRTRNELVPKGCLEIVSRPPEEDRTPTEFAASTELRFPPQPPVGRRWRQFWNLSEEDAAQINEKAQKEDSGAVLRQELFDAYSSMFMSSWRFQDDPPEPPKGSIAPGTTLTGKALEERKDMRERFYRKYEPAIQACRKYGQNEESPNDPAPAARSDDMTAQAFLALPESIIENYNKHLSRAQWKARNKRAELKRAYQRGTPAEKFALHLRFGPVLEAWPKEFI